MKGLQQFYRDFYDHTFHRHFRRPPDTTTSKFRIQFSVETPKNLYLHVHRNSGLHPCLIHTYDHGSRGNLKRKDPMKMVFDRAFFDFDVSNDEAKKLKEKLVKLRSQGLGHEKVQQEKLQSQLQKLITNEEITRPAVEEAKDFAAKYKETFGKHPALFFSGSKGCHAYIFFKASSFKNINQALNWFAGHVKKSFNYQTLDLSVTRDASARLSRVPYSKHQISNLTVVPFTIEDSYKDIVEKSMNPQVETFNREDHSTDFHKHLQKIDQIETHNTQIRKNTLKHAPKSPPRTGKKIDHREFFKKILGEPVKEYPEKEYVMYHCPFPDHDDKKPSFRVHRCGYYCYGCKKKGNYWQFLKEYYGWNDERVRQFQNIIKQKNIIDDN